MHANIPKIHKIRSDSSKGLKVIVHFSTADEACVRTVDDNFRVGCERGQPGNNITFQFPAGAVDVGEDFYACFSEYQQIASINWTKLQSVSEGAVVVSWYQK
jgi:hypothetical protein